MRLTSPHHLFAVALVAIAGLSACPAETGNDIDPASVIVVGNASIDVLLAMADAVDAGNVQIDDARAAQLVTPAPNAQVPRDTPPQFAWAIPQAKRGPARAAGLATGDFVWIRFEAAGFDAPIDVIAVGVTNWTPTAAEWARFQTATDAVSITLTYAHAEAGAITDGPVQGTLAPTIRLI
jgi:hypothetical protein